MADANVTRSPHVLHGLCRMMNHRQHMRESSNTAVDPLQDWIPSSVLVLNVPEILVGRQQMLHRGVEAGMSLRHVNSETDTIPKSGHGLSADVGQTPIVGPEQHELASFGLK